MSRMRADSNIIPLLVRFRYTSCIEALYGDLRARTMGEGLITLGPHDIIMTLFYPNTGSRQKNPHISLT